MKIAKGKGTHKAYPPKRTTNVTAPKGLPSGGQPPSLKRLSQKEGVSVRQSPQRDLHSSCAKPKRYFFMITEGEENNMEKKNHLLTHHSIPRNVSNTKGTRKG